MLVLWMHVIQFITGIIGTSIIAVVITEINMGKDIYILKIHNLFISGHLVISRQRNLELVMGLIQKAHVKTRLMLEKGLLSQNSQLQR